MSSSRNNSSGLRYLWIPGRKRSHPKGRFDSTNKRITYNSHRRNNESWSLGGSKAQKDFLNSETEGDTGPSISGLLPFSCSAGLPTIAVATNMPVSTENKFGIVGKIEDNDKLPSPSKDNNHNGTHNNHISTGDLINNSVSNHNLKKIDEDLEYDLPSPPCCDEHSSDGVSEYSPQKKHLGSTNKKPNSNNRPEIDINSIESVSECKLKYSELDLPDGIYNISQLSDTCKKKKKKKKNKNKNSPSSGTSDEEDEKVVKCLYYTLMCCECTIS